MRIELEDARIEEIDVEGILAFAEYVFCNAACLWVDSTVDQRERLQRVIFPQGTSARRRAILNRRNVLGIHAVRASQAVEFSDGVPNGNRER